MGHRGLAPPDVGTVEVVDGWRPDESPIEPADPGGGRRRLVGLVVALAVAGAVVVSSWLGGSPAGPTRQGAPIGPYRSGSTSGATAPPARFAEPIGHRVVVLTLTGLLVLDPDTGSYSELELGSIRSFGASPAVAPVGPGEVAVLFADHSVGVVELAQRSVRRIAEDVHAVFASVDPGSIWVRRRLAPAAWELVELDAFGQELSAPLHHTGSAPPVVVSGRPVATNAGGPLALDVDGDRHRIEVHERRSTLRAFAVRVQDTATGGERWLRDLSHRPVLTPDGRWLLVGEPISNRLTAYDVERGVVQTVQAPESAGVTLDWDNLAVLPAGGVS